MRWRSVIGAVMARNPVKLALPGRIDSTTQGAMRTEVLGFE
jgi:hypothetical protein